jgi:hypothetical protein
MTDVKWLGETLTVSNSEIQTYKSCKRKWYLVYYRELGLSRKEESPVGPRQLGTRIHTALHSMYADGTNPINVIDGVYANDIAYLQEAERFDDVVEVQKEQDLAHAMLSGYVEWLAETGADDGITLVAAETVIEVPSAVDGVHLRGKLDQRILRESDGARLFLDHKTVGDLSTPAKTLPMDEQMKFYHLLEKLDAMHKTGSEPPWRTDGGLYNMLRKVKRTATAKPPFYGRIEVRHNDHELRNMWIRVHAVIEDIVKTRQQLDAGADHNFVAYPRPSRDCTWSCDFFPVCPMFDDNSNVDGLLSEYYTHINPHQRYVDEETGKEAS